MKKKFQVLLSAVLAAAFLAAFNKAPEPANTDITPTVAVENQDDTTPTETPAATEASDTILNRPMLPVLWQ